jgi:hypothetical protein
MANSRRRWAHTTGKEPAREEIQEQRDLSCDALVDPTLLPAPRPPLPLRCQQLYERRAENNRYENGKADKSVAVTG